MNRLSVSACNTTVIIVGSSSSCTEKSVVEMLLAVKETRCSKPDVQVTWEPASSLPVAAIQEFEKGLMPKVVQHTSDHYGPVP